MDAEEKWLEQIIPEPVTLLGEELKPFSLGHFMLLRRWQNAFVTDGVGVEIGDLVLGVVICSRDYKPAYKYLRRHDLQSALERFGEECGEFDPVEKAKIFQAYVSDAMGIPGFTAESDYIGSPKGSPVWQVVRTRLMAECGMSEETIMNQPLGQTWWDFLTLCEVKGSLRLVGAHESKLMEIQDQLIKEGKVTT